MIVNTITSCHALISDTTLDTHVNKPCYHPSVVQLFRKLVINNTVWQGRAVVWDYAGNFKIATRSITPTLSREFESGSRFRWVFPVSLSFA